MRKAFATVKTFKPKSSRAESKETFFVGLNRLADKEASLKELAERFGVTKSCLNHRLRRLVKMAEELSGEE